MSHHDVSPRQPHSGRTALVTGAATGLGREFARRLAADGADVICWDLNDADGTVADIESHGRRGHALRCDVSDESAVLAAAEATRAIAPVDIVVHSAGVYPFEPFTEITFQSWRRVLAINLDSTFLLASAFLPAMAERGWGRFVGVSSGMFNTGAPGAVHYVASKGGIVGLVRALAPEFGPSGVTVNAIAPGLIETHGTSVGPHRGMGMFDVVHAAQAVKRTGVPTDISGVVSFLASEDASFITGQTLLADGGIGRV